MLRLDEQEAKPINAIGRSERAIIMELKVNFTFKTTYAAAASVNFFKVPWLGSMMELTSTVLSLSFCCAIVRRHSSESGIFMDLTRSS